VRRALVVLAVLVAVWLVPRGTRVATAQEGPHGDAAATCQHCHADPHAGTAKGACADCHTPEAFAPSTFDAARHAATGFALTGRHAEASCTSCHVKGLLSGQPRECAGCHVDRHRGLLGDACTSCHSVEGFTPVSGFDHARTGFALAGAHASVSCEGCHEGAHADALRSGAGPGCDTCHARPHADFGECSTCHSDSHASFAAARTSFDHRMTTFPLERRHGPQACAACHPAAGAPPEPSCGSCHADPHGSQLGTMCQDCHRPDRFSLARFDHDTTGWALRGRHFVTPCAECHTGQRWIGLGTECFDCHALDAGPGNVPAHAPDRTDCADCHNTWGW